MTTLTPKAVLSPRTAFAVLGGYFLLHVLLRSMVSNSLQLDEAEEVVLTQSWEWGYGSQPPLYTWLQKLFFNGLGVTVFAVALLKNSLLFATYVFTYLGAREILQNQRHALLAAFSLLLVPMFSWESQRDQTHLVLATLIATATLYLGVGLVQTRRRGYYGLLGFVMGAGLLAKYNYAIYGLALLIALLSVPAFRSAVLSRNLLLTAAAFLMVVGPHLVWGLTHRELALSQRYKFQMQAEFHFADLFVGARDLGKGVLAFGLLSAMVYGIVFWRAPEVAAKTVRPLWVTVLGRTMLIGLGMSVVALWVFHATAIKGRWLQPLLMGWPVMLVASVQAKLTPGHVRKIIGCVAVALVGVPAVLYGSVVAVRWTGRPTNLNIPYRTLAGQVRAAGFSGGVIVAEGIRLGGNLKACFPDSLVVVPKVFERSMPPSATTLIAWQPRAGEAAPAGFIKFVTRTCGVAWGELEPRQAVAPANYGPQITCSLQYAIVPQGVPREPKEEARER